MSFIKSKLQTAINNNMKNTFKTLLFISLLCGVIGAETVESVTVMEGDVATLNTDEILNEDWINWYFKADKNMRIAQFRRTEMMALTFDLEDGRFSGRLLVNTHSGSLTIKNSRIKHSGIYELHISSRTDVYKTFNLTVTSVSEAEKDEIKTLIKTEGDSVTLHTETAIQTDDLILWRFGDEGIIVAKFDRDGDNRTSSSVDGQTKMVSTYYVAHERLQLDKETGSLTITHSRTTDTGLYKVKVSSSRETIYKKFSVYVRDHSGQFVYIHATAKDAGLSPGSVSGIVVGVLGVVAAVITMIYSYRRISELKKQLDELKQNDLSAIRSESETTSMPLCEAAANGVTEGTRSIS
ncbi:uncharacterized protein LOC127639748 isoform X1 [Xyrauchen texanus]|uniref:uncharacterized protein LOC127639748 isoform X1 n=1 Tax=Xyrauchen texanus TaxID=154827 RepID=UPI0022428A73|nr:uncharacterized protein LOC127639748 isoform X1 [Xyrauchen texanus]